MTTQRGKGQQCTWQQVAHLYRRRRSKRKIPELLSKSFCCRRLKIHTKLKQYNKPLCPHHQMHQGSPHRPSLCDCTPHTHCTMTLDAAGLVLMEEQHFPVWTSAWRDIAGRGECSARGYQADVSNPSQTSGAKCCVHRAHWPRAIFPSVTCHSMELGVSRGKSSAEPRKSRAGPLRTESETCQARRPREGRALAALERRGQAPRALSRALRPASASGLKYYPGVFNYLFLMDLQGLFHQARGGWVWGCGERAARAGAGKMAHISILKPFTIVSSMKDAANKTEPPAPASPSRKF